MYGSVPGQANRGRDTNVEATQLLPHSGASVVYAPQQSINSEEVRLSKLLFSQVFLGGSCQTGGHERGRVVRESIAARSRLCRGHFDARCFETHQLEPAIPICGRAQKSNNVCGLREAL